MSEIYDRYAQEYFDRLGNGYGLHTHQIGNYDRSNIERSVKKVQKGKV
jgi:hypothetical protein